MDADLPSSPRSHEEQNQFWNAYFAIERDAYDKLLSRADEPFKGKLTELAAEFGMEKELFCGFIDGINTSLAAGEYDLEALEEDSDIDPDGGFGEALLQHAGGQGKLAL